MKELLIIRSVSFQQLDLNLPAIIRKFPNYNISILTHEHGVNLAKKYNNIKKIYVYKYKESFSFKRKAKNLNNKTFDILIIPVTNMTGTGFGNVFSFALTIKANKKYMCNLVSNITYITNLKIVSDIITNFIYKILSLILAILSGILLLPYTIYKFRKKESNV